MGIQSYGFIIALVSYSLLIFFLMFVKIIIFWLKYKIIWITLKGVQWCRLILVTIQVGQFLVTNYFKLKDIPVFDYEVMTQMWTKDETEYEEDLPLLVVPHPFFNDLLTTHSCQNYPCSGVNRLVTLCKPMYLCQQIAHSWLGWG